MLGFPVITIVIPTYNAMALLPQCIHSIVEVTGDLLGTRILVKIQDGLSQDGIVEFIDSLPQVGVSIVHEKDKGIYDAMNKAVECLDTPWVYFMGADDRLLPDFLALVNRLDDRCNIVYGNVLYSSDLKKYDGKFNPVKLVYRNICHQAIIYPVTILRETPFLLKYTIMADWASNIDLMSRYDFRYFDYDIAIFNNQSGLSANQRDEMFDAEKNEMFRTIYGVSYYFLSLSAPILNKVYRLFVPRRRKPRI